MLALFECAWNAHTAIWGVCYVSPDITCGIGRTAAVMEPESNFTIPNELGCLNEI
jgi:hypothetical protein